MAHVLIVELKAWHQVVEFAAGGVSPMPDRRRETLVRVGGTKSQVVGASQRCPWLNVLKEFAESVASMELTFAIQDWAGDRWDEDSLLAAAKSAPPMAARAIQVRADDIHVAKRRRD